MAVLKKILFGIIAFVLIILLLELFFRVIPFHRDSGHTISGLVIPDKDLGWRLQPRKEGPLATNELGLRDTTYNPRADKTILLLGDSLSWGDGLGDVKKGYPFLLEKALSQATGRTVEVVNAGVPGYSTFQQLRYLQLYGLALEPDLIILQFCLNDVVERYSAVAAYGGDNVFLGVDTRQFIQGLNGRLLRNSKFYEAVTRLLIGLWRDRREYDVRKLASDKLSRELQSAWELTLSEIDGIHRLAAEKDIPLLIVVAPYRFQLHQPQKTDQPQRILRQYGYDHHIPVVDLLFHFESWTKQNTDVPLFTDGNHFSFWGHELTADILIEPVLKVVNQQNL